MSQYGQNNQNGYQKYPPKQPKWLPKYPPKQPKFSKSQRRRAKTITKCRVKFEVHELVGQRISYSNDCTAKNFRSKII